MTSIYDNIPTLDLWYESKNNKGPEPYRVVPCGKQRTNSNNNTVSFSTAPPAVYCYDNKQEHRERPLHRRNSSSEQVKELFKHYTNKLSRQLSYTS
ncbi:hypothetical protein [Parasitella parasitica]|uniref:Uncharacterized protein n=1 Tax=Parasitella parasitica TaxID=35722 RepID=A0A0B7NV56_9FUNG|nr:hypothetical protein [Parasitella parasitica]